MWPAAVWVTLCFVCGICHSIQKFTFTTKSVTCTYLRVHVGINKLLYAIRGTKRSVTFLQWLIKCSDSNLILYWIQGYLDNAGDVFA